MADLVLKNAKMVTPFGVREGGIAIENEKIVAIGTDNSLPPAPEVIDCRGMVMLPGVFDPHVHLGGRTPYEENIVTETTSAAAGGVTSFLQYLRSADPEYKVVKERIDLRTFLRNSKLQPSSSTWEDTLRETPSGLLRLTMVFSTQGWNVSVM